MTDAAGRAVRPAPVLTEDSFGFWDDARAHRLTAQRCDRCKQLRHPPRPMCPHCNSLDVEVVELSGHGTVYSYSLLHYPQHPSFAYPVIAALIALDEGMRMLSNVVGVDPHEVHIGMRVAVDFAPTAGDMAVPVFRPASS